MPKSTVNTESGDIRELSDEALDRAGAGNETICFSPGQCTSPR